ncbi:MAG: hypothetical protein ACLTR4_05580 [Gallintestinimicrobium sp.]
MDKERSVDIRMNNQQNLVRAYWSTNSTFGVNGPIGRQAQGKMGIYASLGVCITTLITGSIYVFTCLKAWGGAFDVGSITPVCGRSYRNGCQCVFFNRFAWNIGDKHRLLG